MESRRPPQHGPVVFTLEVPVSGDPVEKLDRRRLHPGGMGRIHRPTARHAVDGALAHVRMFDASNQVVEDAFAQRQLRYVHLLDVQQIEYRPQHYRPTHEYAAPVLGQTRQIELIEVGNAVQIFAQSFHGGTGDTPLAPALLLAYCADGLDGTGGTDGPVAGGVAEHVADGLKTELGLELRGPHSLALDLPVGEEPARQRDAADVQAFAIEYLEPLARDHFRAAAADVDDKTVLVPGLEAVGNTEINEACLLSSGNDFDRVSEHRLGPVQECVRVAGLAQGIGSHCSHAAARQVPQPLSEAIQTRQRVFLGPVRQHLVLIQAGAQTDGLPQAIDHHELVVMDLGDDQVETVGAEVHGGDGIGPVVGDGAERHGGARGDGSLKLGFGCHLRFMDT
jgi:hypothetical protein